MINRKICFQLLFIYTFASQVLCRHPCGESPLRRFASLTRILETKCRCLSTFCVEITCPFSCSSTTSFREHKKKDELYPGSDISSAMGQLRGSNPELHRRLEPLVTLLQSEWRQYTECVTMVDTGYFKRSGRSTSESRSDQDPFLGGTFKADSVITNDRSRGKTTQSDNLPDVFIDAFRLSRRRTSQF